MRLNCYRAMCGDAFHLQYVGESGKRRHIFLDMGHSKTYTLLLREVILKLVGASEQIDALFLSHIHDDHVGGASRFIKEMQRDGNLEGAVGHWFYNAPRKYDAEPTLGSKDGVLCGIVYGDKIYEHIMASSPSDLRDVTAGQVYLVDGMRITILSPDKNALNRLRDKYSNRRPLCKSETDEASVEAGRATDDYSTPLHQFDTNDFQEDSNIENASSIAALFELNGKRILWLSDSVPSVVVKSLSELGISESNRLHCDAVLLSHHGSASNNSLALFWMISADKYIISADGINRHCLPNKETVARIVSASLHIPITLYFNYDDGRMKGMFRTDNPEEVKSKLNIHYLEEGEAIEI